MTFNKKEVFWLSLLPLILMIVKAEIGYYGIDAAKEVTHEAGWWALMFLTLTLTATPMMRVFKSRIIMQHRRTLGLWTLFYSLVHLSFYLLFLLPSLAGLWEDILKRPYITVGFAALLILIVLGVTSTKKWQKRLKRKWITLHQTVYLASILIVIHWYWTLRSDIADWAFWCAPIITLLLWRLYKKVRK